MGRIVRSDQSAADLLQLWGYVARDDVSAADRLMDRIDAVLHRLAAAPKLGRERPELVASMRSYTVGKYLIFYQPLADGIELVRVLHGARNLRRLFRT